MKIIKDGSASGSVCAEQELQAINAFAKTQLTADEVYAFQVLLCDNEVMRSVIDRFGEDVSTVTADDGHFKAIVEVAPSPPFFAWVFTFCGKIRILGPEEVLDEMRGMAAWLQ